MKMIFKRLWIPTVIIVGLYTYVQGQCVPGIFTNPGFYPNAVQGLVPAHKGQTNYSMVMNFKSKVDTTLSIPVPPFSLTLPIDSFQLISIEGLPNTFSFQCGNPTCKGKPQSNSTICWEINGNPSITQIGTYPLSIVIRYWVTVFGTPTNIEQTNNQYSLIVNSDNTGSNMEVTNSNLFLNGSSKGIILRDENGVCWRYFANTSGQLIGEQVICPN